MKFITTIKPTDVLKKDEVIYLLKSRKRGNIKGVGHRNGLLYVAFSNGTVYSYEGVPADIKDKLFAIAFNGRESTGKYFNANIKKGGYKYVKVDNVELTDTARY